MPAFLFDIGNVLVTFDFQIAVNKFMPLCRIKTNPMELTRDLRLAYENGEMKTETFIRLCSESIAFTGTESQFRNYYCDIFHPISQMEVIVQNLAQKWPLCLFSNTSEMHLEHLFASFPIFNHFPHGVYSYSTGSSKPKEGMYHKALKYLEVSPDEVIYVDDLVANIQMGKKFGFKCWQYDYKNHAQFEIWLEMESGSQGFQNNSIA